MSKDIISSTVSGLEGSLLNGLKSRVTDVWGTKPSSGEWCREKAYCTENQQGKGTE